MTTQAATMFLGPIGALREIPSGPEYTVEHERSSSDLVTMGGYRRVSRGLRSAREWSVDQHWMTRDEDAFVLACASGAVRGPLYLYTNDAARSNLLHDDLAAPSPWARPALGTVAGTLSVPIEGVIAPSRGVMQQGVAGDWSRTIPLRPGVGYVLSAWGSAAGALIDWRTVSSGGGQVATGTVSATADGTGFYGAVALVPDPGVGLQVRLAAGSRTVGGLRLVEGTRVQDGPVVAKNLVTNPSFESTSGTVEVRRNLFPNPRVASGSGWGAYLGTGGVGTSAVVATTGYPSGLASAYRATWTTAPPAVGGGVLFGGSDAATPAVAGGSYTGSAYVRASVARTFTPRIEWKSAGGTTLSVAGGAPVVLSAGAVTRLSVSGVAPASAAYAVVTFYASAGGAFSVGDYVEAAGALWEASPALGPYFDHLVSPDSDLTPSATSTANQSPSILAGAGVAGAPSTGGQFAVSSQQWAAAGARSVRIIPRGTGNAYTDLGGGTGGLRFGMVAGRTYTILATYRIAAPQTGTLDSLARRVVVYHRTGGTGSYTALPSPAAMSPNVAGEHQIRYTVTLPEGVTEAWPRLFNGASVGNGDVWWDDLAIIEGDYTGPWWDGSHAPAGTYATWDGAPDASTSTLRQIPDDAVTPGWAPGRGVPQVVVDDPTETLQLVTDREILADYTVTIREVG